MNYYSHHIGDFDKKTRHLTRLERSIYRDLIEVYYDSEKQLTLDLSILCRKIIARTNEEATVVEQMLNEFFIKTPTGWYHERCEKELDAYRTSTSQKSVAGKASAAKKALKRQQALDSQLTPVERTLNECGTALQLTKNQEPLINTPIPPNGGVTKKKTSAIALPTYLEICKAENKKPIHEDDSVFSYAKQVGISHEFLRLQWCEFKDRYSAGDAKRYKDWPNVFCKSVRGNWFRLWYASNEGGYALTTQGIQAQQLHEGKA